MFFVVCCCLLLLWIIVDVWLVEEKTSRGMCTELFFVLCSSFSLPFSFLFFFFFFFRIASVFFVSSLPENFLNILKRVEIAMNNQVSANLLVDNVVAQQCDLPLSCRYKEALQLRNKTRIALRTQNETLK